MQGSFGAQLRSFKKMETGCGNCPAQKKFAFNAICLNFMIFLPTLALPNEDLL